MANVLQSAAGANAVMGSKMVLAERCSDVWGSNRMMLPWAFPSCLLALDVAGASQSLSELTKSNIAVPHPRSHPDLLVRGKSCHLVSGKEVPHNRSGPCIVAYHQAATSPLADRVGMYPRYVFAMAGEAPLHRQSVMVQTQNLVSLRNEQEGRSCAHGVECEFIGAGRPRWCRWFYLDF